MDRPLCGARLHVIPARTVMRPLPGRSVAIVPLIANPTNLSADPLRSTNFTTSPRSPASPSAAPTTPNANSWNGRRSSSCRNAWERISTVSSPALPSLVSSSNWPTFSLKGWSHSTPSATTVTCITRTRGRSSDNALAKLTAWATAYGCWSTALIRWRRRSNSPYSTMRLPCYLVHQRESLPENRSPSGSKLFEPSPLLLSFSPMRHRLTTLLLILTCASIALAKDKYQHAGPLRLDRSGEKWAEKTLHKLTLEEKIGQVFMIWCRASFLNVENPEYLQWREAMQTYHVGSFAMTVHVDGPYLLRSEPFEAADLLNRLQQDSKLPLLFAADFERGVSMRLLGR